MYKLTPNREAKAHQILERAYASLMSRGWFDAHDLERELRDCWNVGYHELYQILEDSFRDDRWLYVSAYYMEHVHPSPTSELQHALAKAYGIPKRGANGARETYRAEFWKRSGIRLA
ncbi:MAG: hypothetical protein IJK04_10445 [Kiritimatiellae bacterium]|nr:hypothetical protein [Kiritimatiellia bacterium]